MSSREGLRPEELFQGLGPGVRSVFDSGELVSFLREWSDRDGFVEDLEDVVEGSGSGLVRPETVFESLAASSNDYSVDEMLDLAEEWSDKDWKSSPEIRGTGGLNSFYLGEVAEIPYQVYQGVNPETGLNETIYYKDGRTIFLEESEGDWFQIGLEPVSRDEVRSLLDSFQSLSPVDNLLEARYGRKCFLLDSQDLEFYFELEDEYDGFDRNLNRIDADFGHSIVEAFRIHGLGDWELYMYSRNGRKDFLEAYDPTIDQKLVKSVETKLKLPIDKYE